MEGLPVYPACPEQSRGELVEGPQVGFGPVENARQIERQ